MADHLLLTVVHRLHNPNVHSGVWYLNFMRTPLFPFTDPRCDYMQRMVVDLIESSDFLFELPDLPMDIWQAIIRNEAEKQRLEFLGDALIGSYISELLLHTCPQRHPGFYTVSMTQIALYLTL